MRVDFFTTCDFLCVLLSIYRFTFFYFIFLFHILSYICVHKQTPVIDAAASQPFFLAKRAAWIWKGDGVRLSLVRFGKKRPVE